VDLWLFLISREDDQGYGTEEEKSTKVYLLKGQHHSDAGTESPRGPKRLALNLALN
jgi:hypothetical protein